MSEETAYPRLVDARDVAIMAQVAVKVAADMPAEQPVNDVLKKADAIHQWLIEATKKSAPERAIAAATGAGAATAEPGNYVPREIDNMYGDGADPLAGKHQGQTPGHWNDDPDPNAQSPPAPSSRPMRGYPRKLEPGTSPATNDWGMIVAALERPVRGQLVHLQMPEGGEIRKQRVSQIVGNEPIQDETGTWWICIPVIEQPAPQTQQPAPPPPSPTQQAPPPPPPPQQQPPAQQQGGQMAEVQAYSFSAQYDTGVNEQVDGKYGIKSPVQLQEGQKVLVKGKSGKNFPTLVGRFIRKASMDGGCFIYTEVKIRKDGGGGGQQGPNDTSPGGADDPNAYGNWA